MVDVFCIIPAYNPDTPFIDIGILLDFLFKRLVQLIEFIS